MVERDRSDYPELAGENREIWNENARWWDEEIGAGNDFQNQLVEPASESLLEIAPGDRVLDIACGAGRFTRRIAALGATVTAFDQSDVFIDIARGKSEGIIFHVMDAADEDALKTLGEHNFDKAVATMALMDMADIAPLFRALPFLLRPGGSFVFTVTHPCFHSAEVSFYAELREDGHGRFHPETGVRIKGYLNPAARRTEGVAGQPRPQFVFHRPLNVLLRYGFKHGFVVDGWLEPSLNVADPEPGLRWRNMPDIPPVLAVRLRRAS